MSRKDSKWRRKYGYLEEEGTLNAGGHLENLLGHCSTSLVMRSVRPLLANLSITGYQAIIRIYRHIFLSSCRVFLSMADKPALQVELPIVDGAVDSASSSKGGFASKLTPRALANSAASLFARRKSGRLPVDPVARAAVDVSLKAAEDQEEQEQPKVGLGWSDTE